VRLALHTDYALRTLMYLACAADRSTAAEVAEFYGISAHHVSKVVHRLVKLRLVRSIRGLGGGIELSRSAGEIKIGEVIEAFEGSMHLLDCVDTEDVCLIQRFCKLRGVLAEAEQLQRSYLHGVTLQDVVPRRREMQRVAAI
jgi:Rrf2 family transcriptional regulator, nitric oxide-sensitive transcriptional repressor